MIDLHTHSNASDGELTPSALISLAAEKNISHIALTDHDTISGLNEAIKKADKNNITLIPGVEIEVNFEPGEFHLLGLGIWDYNNGILDNFLKEIRNRRKNRNNDMITKMRDDGLKISLKKLEKYSKGEVTGRLHFAMWLIDNGYSKSVPECFAKFIGPDGPYYIPKHRPEVKEAIEVIHASGGKAVIAHPLSLWITMTRFKKYITGWKENGLDGIEAYHSGASLREAARFAEIAKENNMIITGGSDFHGNGRPDRQLGISSGGRKLENMEMVYPLLEK